ncbi:hypothetical protein KY363_04955 [Candidatus Woesearchaeota archaeon]|nr:hypothetical protein [Candidatus Woesearchaeota archaeon]
MVEVKCKNCGKAYPSTEFTLDPVYRMMVCRKCVSERRMKENPIKAGPASLPRPVNSPVKSAPAPRPEVRTMPSMTRSRNTPLDPGAEPRQVEAKGDKMRQRCRKCGFNYLFDAAKGYPLNCPNCGEPSKSNYNFF